MREWYELLFTPDHATNKMKHYDNVTDLVIDGEPFNRIKERIRADAIDEYYNELEYQFKVNCGIGIDSIERIAEQLKENK